MTSLTKNRKPRTKKNVFFSLQTQRLVESFKGLNSFLAQSLVEIFPRNDLCKLLDFSLNHLAPKVLRVSEKKKTIQMFSGKQYSSKGRVHEKQSKVSWGLKSGIFSLIKHIISFILSWLTTTATIFFDLKTSNFDFISTYQFPVFAIETQNTKHMLEINPIG